MIPVATVSQAKQDIMTTTIGTEEHPGCVRTTGFGVGVSQFFGSASRSSSSATPTTQDQIAKMKEELERELREEIIREMEQIVESMGMTQQHNPMQ